ncbi:MAG: fimbrillin family protein [Muribaculaceae bacterium]|nr:fimbrillin family protein [Muribaculaceae bacterium]
MKIIRVTYFALATLFSVASCSKEATEPDVFDRPDGEIYFKTSLADVAASRAQDMTLDRLESFQVTCFNTADRYKDQAGYLSPYFENATFIRQANSNFATYVSAPWEEAYDWPTNKGVLKFFAFSPSLAVMSDGNPAIKDSNRKEYFNLINTTAENETGVAVGYRLGKVRINPDISGQFDLVTAEASGTRHKDFMAGVDLAFRHQLCQVELKAWGSSEEYNFDIAGVRIGNPVVEGTFVFADDKTASSAAWETSGGAVKDKVDYIYRSAGTSGSGNVPVSADRIFRINGAQHNTLQSAASIMGQGGCAMVIPTENARWEGLDDPNIAEANYSTDKMYFSILMRVSESKSGKVLYPYPGNPKGLAVISYAADSNGNILKRLYAGKEKGTYFTDSDLLHPYSAADGEEIMDFGWAAVPVDVDWSAGKKYIYTLNYTEGIGLHDPADPEPGKLIVGQAPIEWSVSVADWDYAEEDENYNPDLNVP